MLKRDAPYRFHEERLAKWTAAGRGTGVGANYKPWLLISNVFSLGRKHRLKGQVTNRVHHLVSDLERNALFHFDWLGVVDIRERFPLNRERTRRIAKRMGVSHPSDAITACDLVLTTDLLVTFRKPCGRLVNVAYSVLTQDALGKRRVQDNLDIEKRYWNGLGFSWHLLTGTLLRDTKANKRFAALRWLHDWHWVEGVGGLDAAQWEHRSQVLLHALGQSKGGSIGELISRVEATNHFDDGEVLSLIRHLASRKRLVLDLSKGVPELTDPVSTLRLACADGTLERRAA
jgi:hypothetical protein